jgi:peptidoglycan/LPS O-acetylase OafA/YrhL
VEQAANAAAVQERAMKLLGIEASRGFAALLVVTVHASAMLSGSGYFGALPFGGLFKFGHAGVDFFFVLSGFIITYIHADDIGRPARLGSYARKRFIRIYPTYWAALAVMAALLVVSPTADRTEQQVGTLVTSVFLLPYPIEPILGVAWSLKHEVMFYLLFGLLLLNRRLGLLAMGAWGLLILWNVAVSWATGDTQFHGLLGSLVFRIFNIEFFFGIAVAIAIRRGWISRPRLIAVLGLALFLGVGLYEAFGPKSPVEWPPRHLGYATGAALMLWGVAGAELTGRLSVPRAVAALGAASYSLYLVHVIVLLFVRQAGLFVQPHVQLPTEVWFLIGVVSATSAGLLFCRHVEKPLLHRLSRWRGRGGPVQALP